MDKFGRFQEADRTNKPDTKHKTRLVTLKFDDDRDVHFLKALVDLRSVVWRDGGRVRLYDVENKVISLDQRDLYQLDLTNILNTTIHFTSYYSRSVDDMKVRPFHITFYDTLLINQQKAACKIQFQKQCIARRSIDLTFKILNSSRGRSELVHLVMDLLGLNEREADREITNFVKNNTPELFICKVMMTGTGRQCRSGKMVDKMGIAIQKQVSLS